MVLTQGDVGGEPLGFKVHPIEKTTECEVQRKNVAVNGILAAFWQIAQAGIIDKKC